MNEISRESFVFYRSFYESLSELSDESIAKSLRAICEYALDGTVPTLSGVEKAVFVLIKPQIDANNKRYINGKHGGRKPKQNQEETEPEPNRNQEETEPEANANVNANVNVNVNANANTNTEEAPGFFGRPSALPAHGGSKLIEEARNLWNLLGAAPAERYTVLQFRPNDIRDCLATVSQFSMDEIREALETYLALLKSPDHSVADYPYRSFAAFMRKGVAKFVSSADPWNTTKRKAAPVAAGKAGLVQWPKGGVNAHG